MSTTFSRGENPLYADKLNTAFSERVSRAGDTMNGLLTLAKDPVSAFDAATKQYVDRLYTVGLPPPGSPYLPLTGGTITGGSLFLDYRLSQPGPNDQPAPNSGLLVRWTPTTPGIPANAAAPLNVVASDNAGAMTSIWGISVSMSVSSAVYGAPGVGPWPQHVGGSFTVAKTGGNPWVSGIHVTAREQNGKPSSSNSGLIGIEIAHQASGDDDGGQAFSPGSRLGIHMSSQAWPAPKWAASTSYAAGAIVNPPSGSAVVFTYICTVGGTSGSTQPTWPVSAGTVTDGSVTWSLNGYLCVHGMGYNLDGGTGTIIKSLFGVTGAITYQAFDARTATAPPDYTDPVAALRMSVGQIIDFNGASTLTHAGWIGPAGSYLQFVSASPNRLRWVSGGNEVMSINDLGTLTIAPLTPNPAIVIGAEDSISFTVNQNRTLSYTQVDTSRLKYMSGATEVWSISDAGVWAGTGFGTGIGQVPVFQNYQGSGFSSLAFPSRLVLTKSGTTSGTDFATINVNRSATHTGGGTGTVTSFLSGVTSGPNVSNQEWAILGQSQTSSTVAGMCAVGVFGLGIRTGASIADIWGGILNAKDETGVASSVQGGIRTAAEIDMVCSGADDSTNNAARFGGTGQRQHIQLAMIRWNTSVDMECSTGLWFTAQEPTHATYLQGIGCQPGVQMYQLLDARGAVTPPGYTDPFAAVRMSANQIIDFNGGTTLKSNSGAYLQYRSATGRLYYVVAGVDMWSVDAGGNVRAKGTLTGSTTP